MNEIQHLFERLRSGTVPEQGLKYFAVGIDPILNEIRRQLDFVSSGNGSFKFLRGGYGCGKTFMSQYTMLEALEQNYVVSFVVVSPNDTQFHKFDEVYHKIVTNMKTSLVNGGAFENCIDCWISNIEEQVIDEVGLDHPDFDEKVKNKFDSELLSLKNISMGNEFINVLKVFFDAKQKRDYETASSLISWLSGSKNVSAKIKNKANIKGEISSSIALSFLKGILTIIKRAGFKGFVIIIDELETLLRTRTDVRGKSLNGLRQIVDNSKDYPGMLWVFTGTEEFFDSKKGVNGLQPLNDRIKFQKNDQFTNYMQSQLELKRFDEKRLVEVAIKLREIYPSENKNRILSYINDQFINQMISKITGGLSNDIGVVPRIFLREFVQVLDMFHQHENYSYEFKPENEIPLPKVEID